MSNKTAKIGLFGIGLDTYWPQFPELKGRLEGYLSEIAAKLTLFNPEVVNLGLVDTVDKAFEAGSTFRREEVSIIFLHASTYALSSTVFPVVRQAKVPIIILNLTPEAAIDYNAFNAMGDRTKMTGEWLAYCSACPVPEIASVFNRASIAFHEVTGMLHEETCWNEVREWVEAAKVAHTMFYNRLGCMGHYYSGMLDIYADLTQQYAYFGGHIEIIEVDELSALRKNVSAAEIADRVKRFYECFDVQPDCAKAELERAARTSVALDRLMDHYQLGSMAYYYKGTGTENADTMSSIILGTSLLTARHIPVAGEYEIKNAQAMKILDSFGAGGSFTEYYAVDFHDDIVLMGHDGPGHICIAEGKIKVRPLNVYHGKVGEGLSVEMSVKNGPVTLLAVVQRKSGELSFLVAEAESVAGPILEIGNTNSRYRFPIGAKNFINSWNKQGPAHHCAVAVGHIAAKIEKLGHLLGMETVIVC